MNERNEKIQYALKQLSECGDNVFSCSDSSQKQGFFEQKTQFDLQVSHKNSKKEIESLLKIRARFKNWLHIAEQIQKKYSNL